MDELSEQGVAQRAQVQRERDGERRHISIVVTIASALAVVSTLISWANHPLVERSTAHPRTWVLHEVSHSIGLLTSLAGPAVLVLAIAQLWTAGELRRGSIKAGWATLLAALVMLGLSSGEIAVLLLGRRNFLDHSRRLNPAQYPPLAHAVGAGLWLAVLASVVVLAGASFYLRRSYATWRW